MHACNIFYTIISVVKSLIKYKCTNINRYKLKHGGYHMFSNTKRFFWCVVLQSFHLFEQFIFFLSFFAENIWNIHIILLFLGGGEGSCHLADILITTDNTHNFVTTVFTNLCCTKKSSTYNNDIQVVGSIHTWQVC